MSEQSDETKTPTSQAVDAAVQWETPRRGRSERTRKFAALAPQLKENPGRWALAEEGLTAYRTQAAVMAHNIKTGDYKDIFPDGEFDAVSRMDKVYVRYIGPNGEYANVED